MRKFGAHAIVALAGLVACSRFGSDDGQTAEPPLDAGPSVPVNDAGPQASNEAAVTKEDASSAFGGRGGLPVTFQPCLDSKALFCHDFEEGSDPWQASPTGAMNEGFKSEVKSATDVNGTGDALHIIETDLPASLGSDKATFTASIAPDVVESALALQVDYQVYVKQSDDFQFARLGGFLFTNATHSGYQPHTVQLYGQGTLILDGEQEDPAEPRLEPKLDTWHHARVFLYRSTPEPSFTREVYLDEQLVYVKEGNSIADGSLSVIAGAFDTSVGAKNAHKLDVWFDEFEVTVAK